MTAFHKIAAMAGKDQILVIQLSLGDNGLCFEVIDVEFASDLAPGFPLETINATKGEFISQPRTIGIVRLIASRSMAAGSTRIGVVENQGESERLFSSNF